MSQGQEATVTEMPKKDLRDRILTHPHRKGKLVKVSEWDATVELRSMSIADKSRLLKSEGDEELNWLEMFPEVVICTCYDPDTGTQLFTAEDLDWLREQPTSVIERLAVEGWNVSGLGEGATEEKKDDS